MAQQAPDESYKSMTHSYPTVLGRQNASLHHPTQPNVVWPSPVPIERKKMVLMKGEEKVTRILKVSLASRSRYNASGPKGW